jgi:hypothetical protein
MALGQMEPHVGCHKGKTVKLSLCLTKHHAMKAYQGSGGTDPDHSLTSALDEGERSASCPGRFIPREGAPG